MTYGPGHEDRGLEVLSRRQNQIETVGLIRLDNIAIRLCHQLTDRSGRMPGRGKHGNINPW
jgi:hypothetical protein